MGKPSELHTAPSRGLLPLKAATTGASRARVALATVTLTLALCSCRALDPSFETRGQGAKAITNGSPDQKHPAVGSLSGGRGFCTATLIGEKLVLTAAHCVEPGKIHRFEVEGRVYASSSKPEAVVRHPSWKDDPKVLSLGDLALVFLTTKPSVAPIPLNPSAPPIAAGLPLILVGYGKAGTTIPGLGVKRRTENEIDEVEPTRFRFSGSSGSEGGTCLGDSGGPALATIEGEERIVGVTSTASAECGVYTWDTRVDAYFQWILSTAKDALPPQPAPPSDDLGGCQVSPRDSKSSGRPLGLMGWILVALLMTRHRRRGRSAPKVPALPGPQHPKLPKLLPIPGHLAPSAQSSPELRAS